MNKRTTCIFTRILLTVLLAMPTSIPAKTKVVLIAGRDSHGASAHNWGDGVDLLSDALTKESGLDIETATYKGGWPKDASIFDGAATVVILSDGGGRHPINRALQEFDALAEKGVGRFNGKATFSDFALAAKDGQGSVPQATHNPGSEDHRGYF